MYKLFMNDINACTLIAYNMQCNMYMHTLHNNI